MIDVISEVKLTAEQKKSIIEYAENNRENKEATIKAIVVTVDENGEADLDIEYVQNKPKFERVRRITGYLSGSTDTWNNAKRAEEHDRVAHFME